jgi:hypothetical protein
MVSPVGLAWIGDYSRQLHVVDIPDPYTGIAHIDHVRRDRIEGVPDIEHPLHRGLDLLTGTFPRKKVILLIRFFPINEMTYESFLIRSKKKSGLWSHP